MNAICETDETDKTNEIDTIDKMSKIDKFVNVRIEFNKIGETESGSNC